MLLLTCGNGGATGTGGSELLLLLSLLLTCGNGGATGTGGSSSFIEDGSEGGGGMTEDPAPKDGIGGGAIGTGAADWADSFSGLEETCGKGGATGTGAAFASFFFSSSCSFFLSSSSSSSDQPSLSSNPLWILLCCSAALISKDDV